MKVLIHRLVAILLTFTFLFGINNFAFAEWKDLQVLNNTGFSIKKLYITSSGYRYWGPDRIKDKGILYNGKTANIRYDTGYKNMYS